MWAGSRLRVCSWALWCLAIGAFPVRTLFPYLEKWDWPPCTCILAQWLFPGPGCGPWFARVPPFSSYQRPALLMLPAIPLRHLGLDSPSRGRVYCLPTTGSVCLHFVFRLKVGAVWAWVLACFCSCFPVRLMEDRALNFPTYMYNWNLHKGPMSWISKYVSRVTVLMT